VFFGAFTDDDKVDVFGIATGRGKVNLVKDRAAAHGNFLGQNSSLKIAIMDRQSSRSCSTW